MGIAILENMVLWEDLPPDTRLDYDLPVCDIGVDAVRLDAASSPVATGQMKYYGTTSKVDLSHMTKFAWCSQNLLMVDELVLGLRPESRLTCWAQLVVDRNIPKPIRISTCTLAEIEAVAAELLGRAPPLPEQTSSVVLRRGQREAPAAELLAAAPPAPGRTPNIVLRRGQREALAAFRDSPEQIFRVQLPCGYGKSQIAVELLKDYKRVIILVNSKDLLHQFVERLSATKSHELVLLGDKKTAWPSVDFPPEQAIVVVSTYQSASKVSTNHPWDFIVCDEAHHVQRRREGEEDEEDNDSLSSPTTNKHGGGWRENVERLTSKKTRVLELSATHRGSVDYSFSNRDAIQEGVVSDYQIQVHVLGKNGNTTLALQRLVEEKRVLWGATLLYFNTTRSASDFCKALRGKNVRAVTVTAETPVKQRREIASQLETGGVELVCVCGCWNESIDLACISAVVFVEPRGSPINKVQVARRGSRLHPNKAFYRVILWTTEDNFSGVDDKLLRCFFDDDDAMRECVVRHRRGGKGAPLRLRVVLDPELKKDVIEAERLQTLIWDRCGRLCPLTQREKAEAFVDLLKTENADDVFSYNGGKLFTDGVNVGTWWRNATKVGGGLIDEDNEVKAILMADPTAKARYDDIQAKRSKKKAAGPVTPLTQREKAEAFVELLKTENADNVFSYSGGNSFTDGTNVGKWWANTTQVGATIEEDNDVRAILMADPTAKARYDVIQAKRKQRKVPNSNTNSNTNSNSNSIQGDELTGPNP